MILGESILGTATARGRRLVWRRGAGARRRRLVWRGGGARRAARGALICILGPRGSLGLRGA